MLLIFSTPSPTVNPATGKNACIVESLGLTLLRNVGQWHISHHVKIQKNVRMPFITFWEEIL